MEKLVWVPNYFVLYNFIPSYAFDALLCRNWRFSPPNRLTLRITLMPEAKLHDESLVMAGWVSWESWKLPVEWSISNAYIPSLKDKLKFNVLSIVALPLVFQTVLRDCCPEHFGFAPNPSGVGSCKSSRFEWRAIYIRLSFQGAVAILVRISTLLKVQRTNPIVSCKTFIICFEDHQWTDMSQFCMHLAIQGSLESMPGKRSV